MTEFNWSNADALQKGFNANIAVMVNVFIFTYLFLFIESLFCFLTRLVLGSKDLISVSIIYINNVHCLTSHHFFGIVTSVTENLL